MQATPSFAQHGPNEPRFPVILSVPHAGRDYPKALLEMSRIAPERLTVLEDRHADLLIADALDQGFTALVASRARAWIDLNRDPREIDPDMIAPPPPGHAVIRSAKVNGGLGLIPRRLRGLGEIHRHRLPRAELDSRIAADHTPYHARLATLLSAAQRRFGVAILLDVHSMPPIADARVVIGDGFGRGAATRFASIAEATAKRAGHATAQNVPYAGGYIMSAHGAPGKAVHAIQIEIDRSLYLDSLLDRPGRGLQAARAMVLAIAHALADEALGTTAIAAE
jgi:N-formylglutamate amidohydrolase